MVGVLKFSRILPHLACFLAGWGIVTAFKPALSSSSESRAATKASVRKALDREQGEKLLRRLAPDIAPAAPAGVKHHEPPVAEPVAERSEDNPFGQDVSEATAAHDNEFLRDEIRDVISGYRGPELSYAFRHGRMDAPQVLATLRQTLPDLAGDGSFDEAVFFELSAIDPTRAAVLLDGHSTDERFEAISGGFVTHSDDLDPEARLAWSHLGSSVDVGMDPPFEVLASRLGKPDYYREFGNDYTEWLLDQPPSKGREAMMEALMEHLVMEDPAAAVALRKRLSTR